MTVGTLDRKTLYILLGGLALIVILRWGVYGGDRQTAVAAPTESVPMAEQRLALLRQRASTVPAKEAMWKQASLELASREKGLLQADTSAQAQAQLLDIIRRVAAANNIDARGAEDLREARPLGNNYGEVSVSETFNCQIEQLVNFLAQLANEPAILATREIHINSLNDKKKTIQVRLSLSGVVPKKLVPVKKAGAF